MDRDDEQVHTTLTFDRYGKLLEVKDARGKRREGRQYPSKAPEIESRCPEGETEITAVKTVEVVYVTCADTKDPCWVFDPATRRWYYVC